MSEPRNPVWPRDEIILALDLYLRRRNHLPDENDLEVAGLSGVLQKMAGRDAARFKNFRSPSAVAMKLANIQSIDPAYTQSGKKGLPGGGRGDSAVWADFIEKPFELQQAALAIRAAVAGGQVIEREEDGGDEGEDEAPEGRILAQMHKRRERRRVFLIRREN